MQRLIFQKKLGEFSPDLYFHSQYIKVIPTTVETGWTTLVGEVERIDFGTYFNLFSIKKWKSNTTIEDLFFQLQASGKCVIKISHLQQGIEPQTILEVETELSDDKFSLHLPIENYDLGYFSVELIKCSENFKIGPETGFYSNAFTEKKISLNLVITHFNRVDSIKPTLHKISKELKADTILKDCTKIVVVDNSKNIPLNEFCDLGNVVILPNENYGGCGGYAKGLLYSKLSGVSHCLFTDDDVLFDIESIRRTFVILSLSKNQNLAIVGGILSKENPRVMIQAGAKFSSQGWICQSESVNLHETYGVVAQDSKLASCDFGAWPYFAFPISSVTSFPFPFFVRGDDVLFGLLNDFRIRSFNGIGVTVENIIWREGPASLYQDVRAILVINIIKKSPSDEIVRYLKELFKGLCQSYKYASAEAVVLAMQDVLKGPEYFSSNLDNCDARRRLRPLALKEKFEKISDESPDHYFFSFGKFALIKKVILRFKKLFREISFDIYPKRLPESIFQEKGLFADIDVVSQYEEIFYYCTFNDTFYKAKFSKEQSKRIAQIFRQVLCELKTKLPDLREQFSSTSIGSESFWKEKYKGLEIK